MAGIGGVMARTARSRLLLAWRVTLVVICILCAGTHHLPQATADDTEEEQQQLGSLGVLGSQLGTLEMLYMFAAGQNFYTSFDAQICCQDQVVRSMMPKLHAHIVRLDRGFSHSPTRPLVFAFVGPTNTGKSHTLNLLAASITEIPFEATRTVYSDIIPPSVSPDQARMLLAGIAAQVRENSRSTVIVELLQHLSGDSHGSRILIRFFRAVVARGVVEGVDYRHATFAFSMDNAAASEAMADALSRKMQTENMAGPEAIKSLRWEDWGPDVEQAFRLQTTTSQRLSFLLKPDYVIPFWPLDTACIKCAIKKEVLRTAAVKELAKEVEKLLVPPSVLARLLECRNSEASAPQRGSLWPDGATGIKTVVTRCMLAAGARFNPEIVDEGWLFDERSYKWQDKRVVVVLNPTQTAANKCKNTMQDPMCLAIDDYYPHQPYRWQDL